MAVVQTVWRFQGDPQPGDTDPQVQVYLRDTTTVDGVEFVSDETIPTYMKLSELMHFFQTDNTENIPRPIQPPIGPPIELPPPIEELPPPESELPP